MDPNRLRVSLLAQARLRRDGAGPRGRRRWRAVLTHPTAVPPHSPSSLRPDPERSARRCPASRAQSVAPRWPPATLDPRHRRASGLAIGSMAPFRRSRFRAPPRPPNLRAKQRRTPCTVARPPQASGEAFATRISGVRIPSSSTRPAPRLTCRNAVVGAGFSRCHSALLPWCAHPRPPGCSSPSNPARSADDPRWCR